VKAQTFKRPSARKTRAAKTLNAKEAIGKIEHGQDVYILTFGQFSAIDALVNILDQTGPADVVISTWTAADAHLERTFQLMASSQIKDLRMIVDMSFINRQPEYVRHIREKFGEECIRSIRVHSKFMLISNDDWKIVIRTSMNLNENPRLENIEITEDPEFFEWFSVIVDDIFSEEPPGNKLAPIPQLNSVKQPHQFDLLAAEPINRSKLNEPEYTHTVKR